MLKRRELLVASASAAALAVPAVVGPAAVAAPAPRKMSLSDLNTLRYIAWEMDKVVRTFNAVGESGTTFSTFSRPGIMWRRPGGHFNDCLLFTKVRPTSGKVGDGRSDDVLAIVRADLRKQRTDLAAKLQEFGIEFTS